MGNWGMVEMQTRQGLGLLREWHARVVQVAAGSEHTAVITTTGALLTSMRVEKTAPGSECACVGNLTSPLYGPMNIGCVTPKGKSMHLKGWGNVSWSCGDQHIFRFLENTYDYGRQRPPAGGSRGDSWDRHSLHTVQVSQQPRACIGGSRRCSEVWF